MFFKSSCQFKSLLIIALCSGCTVYLPPTNSGKRTPPSPQNSGTSTILSYPVQPENHLREYIVKKGDTLYGIAQQFGCTYLQLAQWNQLSPANSSGTEPHYNLFPGQHLQIRDCR